MVRYLAVGVLMGALALPAAGCSKAKKESTQLLNEGVKSFRDKKYDAAYSYFRKSVELYPENAQAFYHMGMVDFYQRDDAELARQNLENAKKFDPADRDILFTLGRLKVEKLNELKSALTDLDAALALDENYHPAWYVKGVGLRKLGKFDEADAAWRECISIDPKYARCFVALSSMYEHFEKEEAAEAVYHAGLKGNPGSSDMLNGLGVLLMKQGKYTEAVLRFEGVLQRDQTRMDALFNLAFGYSELAKALKDDTPEKAKARKKKNLKRAINYLDKFISMSNRSDKENIRAARSMKNALVTELGQR